MCQLYRVSQKIVVLWKNSRNYLICYQMGTEIFKIEEEMTEKMMPKVANPPPKIGRIHCSHPIMHSFDDPLHFHDLQ